MEKILDFFEENFNLSIPDREWRLNCILKHQAKFYRKKKPLERELFSDEQIRTIDERIRQTQVILIIIIIY